MVRSLTMAPGRSVARYGSKLDFEFFSLEFAHLEAHESPSQFEQADPLIVDCRARCLVTYGWFPFADS